MSRPSTLIPFDAIRAFLSLRNIAVYGVSSSTGHAANAIAKKMLDAGYHVFPIHPSLKELHDRPCFPDLASVPETVEGVFIFTSPEHALEIVDACIDQKVQIIWMHNMLGTCTRVGKSLSKKMSSVSDEGVEKAQEAGIRVINGSCPMQFIEPVDPFHWCIRWFNEKAGNMG